MCHFNSSYYIFLKGVVKLNKYKLFISYAREEIAIKEKLISYLKPQVDLDRLEIWHDKEMKVGDKFDAVIKEKLNESDIVVFLLSQDFLNSDYCRDVEEEIALKKYLEDETDNFRIIPIVASKCHFQYSELRHFNMPLDAKSISEYGSEAYYQLSKDITEVLDFLDHSTKDNKVVVKEKDYSIELTNDFKGYLNELGFTIQKSGVDHIRLQDLFVYPDLKKINNEIENIDVFVDSQKLIRSGDFKNKYQIFMGDEQSGKTTLVKMLYLGALTNGLVPILVKGEEIKSYRDLEKLKNRGYEAQYVNNDILSESDVVLIIDGLSDSPLNQKFMKILINSEISKFHSVIITCDSMLRMQEQIMNEFKIYQIYELQSLGSKKKDELVNKWNLLGREESDCIHDMQSQHDSLIQSIDSVMMRNIVPSKPVFVLMILQILETNTANDFSLTSYGHCYHSLIIDAFNRAHIRNDQYADYFNYLSELAFYMYNKGSDCIDGNDISIFQSAYSENYLIISHEEVFGKIIKSKIIVKNFNDIHKFQYKYLFYFFIAKHIAESDKLLDYVNVLCDKIYSEKHANILIFVTHHTKQKIVIDTIIDRVGDIFSDEKPATLNCKELKFLNEFAEQIPQMVIDKSKDVEQERQKVLDEKDQFEKESSLIITDDDDDDDELEEDISSINRELLDVNRSYRSLEILGQIIRNRKGSLPKPLLDKLGFEAFSVGLRFLSYYLGITQTLKEEILEEIHRLIATKKSWEYERITQEARFFYWTFSYTMSLNVIRKTALSVGHKDLQVFYEKIANEIGSEVAKLIEIQIDIEFTKKIPRQKLSELWLSLEDNLVTRRLLQEILVRHLHLNYVDHTDKQWISTNIEIPLLKQEQMQLQVKKVKQLTVK